MTSKKLTLAGILTFILTSPLWAQCPGGKCSTRAAYWTPFGWTYYQTPSRCSGGKCSPTKPAQAAEPEDPVPQTVEIKPFCQRVIELVNAQRKAAGLSPLALDETLCQGCDSHSRYMRSNGFGHAYGIGARECIAYGVSTPEAVVRLWLNSAGHRAILLGGGRIIGVGFSGVYWTLRVR